MFIRQVLGITGQYYTYFFLLPLTQRLILSEKNQNLYSTLLIEQYSFFIPLYVEARVPCLLVPTLALHKVMSWFASPTSFDGVG